LTIVGLKKRRDCRKKKGKGGTLKRFKRSQKKIKTTKKDRRVPKVNLGNKFNQGPETNKATKTRGVRGDSNGGE